MRRSAMRLVASNDGNGCRRWLRARLAALREGLDDDHAAAAARTWMRAGWRLGVIGGSCIGGLGFGLRDGEQFACPRDVVGTGGFGEQPVVADAMEALRQDVAEEAADELVGCEGHELVARTAVGTIVLVLEGNAAPVAGDQPAV